MVMSKVLTWTHQLEVANSVIVFDFVFMVDKFVIFQLPTQMVLHHLPVDPYAFLGTVIVVVDPEKVPFS